MSMTLDELLQQAREKSDAATKGPWHVAKNPEGHSQPAFPYVHDSSGLPHGGDIVTQPLHDSDTVKANSAFIAFARTALPLLVRIVARQREALDCCQWMEEPWEELGDCRSDIQQLIEKEMKP